MAVPVLVIAGLKAVTDNRIRNVVIVLVTAIFIPIIIVILMLLTLFSGTDELNKNLLDYSFTDVELPSDFAEEQQRVIENMRMWLAELDNIILENEEYSLDLNMVKAVFYCLKFGSEPQINDVDEEILFDYISFCDCFQGKTFGEIDVVLKIISEKFIDIKLVDKEFIESVYQYLLEKNIKSEVL